MFYCSLPVWAVDQKEGIINDKYEVMYIIRPNIDEAAKKEIIERYNEVLKENGAEVTTVDERGKRRLAYEINDFREGYYMILE